MKELVIDKFMSDLLEKYASHIHNVRILSKSFCDTTRKDIHYQTW